MNERMNEWTQWHIAYCNGTAAETSYNF